MKKKIVLIVFGSLFAVVALVAALFYLKGPFVGFPGSRTADGSRAVTDGGVKIAGWTGNVDAAEQKAGMNIRDAKLTWRARGERCRWGRRSSTEDVVQRQPGALQARRQPISDTFDGRS